MLGFELVVVGALVICIIRSLWGVFRGDSQWRALAVIPLAAIMPWALKYCDDLSADRTPHTVLPFAVIEAAVLIAPYMLVISVARRIAAQQ